MNIEAFFFFWIEKMNIKCKRWRIFIQLISMLPFFFFIKFRVLVFFFSVIIQKYTYSIHKISKNKSAIKYCIFFNYSSIAVKNTIIINEVHYFVQMIWNLFLIYLHRFCCSYCSLLFILRLLNFTLKQLNKYVIK